MAEESGNWKDCVQYGVVTDIGRRRSNQQDNYSVHINDEDYDRGRGHLFIVADGMGAHAAGELASKIAVDAIPHHYLKYSQLSPPEALNAGIRSANSEIYKRGQENAEFYNMGTTASSMLLLPQGALIGHVGDSRVYRLRQDRLDQLTRDHSLVWELRENGHLSAQAEDAGLIPKNVITRSLGPSATVEVDIEGPDPVQVGDVYLLCSDGLTGRVGDEELGPILSSLPPLDAARVLTDLANLRGGPDNITVIVVRIIGDHAATETKQAEPLTIGGAQEPPHVNVAIWIAAAVLSLAALVLLIIDLKTLAVASAGAGLIALVIGLLQQNRTGKKGTQLGPGLRLGKGPHVTLHCPANEKFVKRLAKVIDELREAAIENEWQIDWRQFDEFSRQAAVATGGRNYSTAVQQYSHAIHYMMGALRKLADRTEIEY